MLHLLAILLLFIPPIALLVGMGRASRRHRHLPLRARLAMASDIGEVGIDDDGGDDDDSDDDGGDDDDSDDDGGDDDDKPLGPKGQKAFEANKAKLKKARADLQEFKKLGLSPAELAKLVPKAKPKDKDKDKDDDSHDDGPTQAQIEAEANRKANRKVVRAELKAAATGKLADPADALAFIDLDQFDVDGDPDDFDVDEDELADAIGDLLKRKPHLAAKQGKRHGDGDGGPRGGKDKPEPKPGMGRLRNAYEQGSKSRRK